LYTITKIDGDLLFRWHQIYNESFKELGYYPIKNLLLSLFPNYHEEEKKNMMKVIVTMVGKVLGLFASFLCSGIFHEYIFYSLFGTSKGEHLTFFLFQGFLGVIWEYTHNMIQNIENFFYYFVVTIFINNNNDDVVKNNWNIFKKFIEFIIWNSILIFTIPWFIEPYIRKKHYYCFHHLICNNK
jgi:hypothetical protein